jgi:predicted RNA-binding protein
MNQSTRTNGTIANRSLTHSNAQIEVDTAVVEGSVFDVGVEDVDVGIEAS